ncbi:MAG TPA: hypothetical protein VF941_14310 [Clostridia bacterium]
MNETWKTIKTIFLHQTVQIIVVCGGLAITLINIFVASKLAPLASDIATIAQKVQADDTRINTDEKYIPQLIQLEQTVTDINPRLDRIESKVDSIDNFLRGYK